MRIYDIIDKKKNGKELSKEEIEFFVNGYTFDKIPDYQISALLMAILLKDMNEEETFYLTSAMLETGNKNEFDDKLLYVDKHSTGGVSDSTTLLIAPIISSLGLKLAKMSGFALGHTGGTLDKLTSIPNFNINLDKDEFKKIVDEVGASIIGQTESMVLADKKLYALRDVTATVDSIPLIASSVMSKKLASGSNIILLDVKCGEGAFMKTKKSAKELATSMVKIGEKFGRQMTAYVTNMNEPLGDSIGCNAEVKEVIEILKGKKNNNLRKLSALFCAKMLLNAKKVKNEEEGIKLVNEVLDNGTAYVKFKKIVMAQGGDVSFVEDESKFTFGKNVLEIRAEEEGYITKLNAFGLGRVLAKIYGGREKKGDAIDHEASIILNKKINNYVKKNDIILTIYYNKCTNLNELKNDFKNIIEITDKKVSNELVYEVI